MDIFNKYLDAAQDRLVVYGFLARVYRAEVDEGFLASLKEVSFDELASQSGLGEGAALLQDYLHRPTLTMRKDLAVDFAKVFLAAGISQGAAAFPYESVYTSPDRLVMQEARDQVLSLYRTKGIALNGVVEPEDHLAFELEFMLYLIGEGKEAVGAADFSALENNLQEQREFLQNHLLNWVPDFCEDVQACANTDFYKAVAQITGGFLFSDAAWLAKANKEEESTDGQ